MKKYYLHDGTEQFGPFDLDELKTKNINCQTPNWYDGWIPITQKLCLQIKYYQ